MSVRILTGDCREVLPTLEAESVHCVVTSPPYWGLRNYGVDGQLGLERSLGEHIETMVEVFREVRRVLRKDGTVWLNYGDCYAACPNGRAAADIVGDDRAFRDKPFSTVGPVYDLSVPNVRQTKHPNGTEPQGRIRAGGYLKPKDLCMIPARVAIALQEDGWWLRSEIVWAKPNPMPESVTDRPTSSHEKVYLLAKNQRYFYDAEAVRENADPQYAERYRYEFNAGPKELSGQGRPNGVHNTRGIKEFSGKRNLRNVWTIATAPFSEAHFATFPPALIEPCIKAGTSEKGCCAECGAPWVREVECEGEWRAQHDRPAKHNGDIYRTNPGGGIAGPNTSRQTRTAGWRLACDCRPPFVDNYIPCTVLDPFGGAGTTGLVADRLGRNAILIELNPQYADMAQARIRQDAGMFAEIA